MAGMEFECASQSSLMDRVKANDEMAWNHKYPQETMVGGSEVKHEIGVFPSLCFQRRQNAESDSKTMKLSISSRPTACPEYTQIWKSVNTVLSWMQAQRPEPGQYEVRWPTYSRRSEGSGVSKQHHTQHNDGGTVETNM